MRKNSRLLTIVALTFLLVGCNPRINISKVQKSTLELHNIQFEAKGTYAKPIIRYFIKKINSPDKIYITSGIDLFRVSYYTKDEANKNILVSGLLAIPRNKKIKGVVSYQHGTNSERAKAPSQPSQDEGLAISAVFAGGGYLVLIPDYIGFGVSNEIHTYLHVETTVNAVVDLLKLGAEICNNLTGKDINQLYLVGASQGGHATAAVHRYLERSPVRGLDLIASSSVSGAYNLREISIPYAIDNNSVFYLGYLANSYCHIYNHPLSSIVSSPYDTAVSKIFDGNHSYDQIKLRLPKNANGFYTKEILNDLKTGQKDWFNEKLEENRTDNWKPIARFRMYYGSKDNDVSPMDAENAYRKMKLAGGNVQLIGLGDLNHLQSIYSGLPKTRAYFDSLSVVQ
jgi:pimeloyl-ACP methyl ester carboxylesterase